LFKYGEEEEVEYFGMLIGLSGLQNPNSDSTKALVDRSVNQYYAGKFVKSIKLEGERV